MSNTKATAAAVVMAAALGAGEDLLAQTSRVGNAPKGAPKPPPSGFDIEKYFSEMLDDVSVYDPASPWIYEGPTAWRRRVDQMFKIRQFSDLNQFHRTEVELGDMKIATVYREIRRPEGSFTQRLHGRITWVWLKQPDGRWFLWHDHTAEIPEDYSYAR